MSKSRLITGETTEFYVVEGGGTASDVILEYAKLALRLEAEAEVNGEAHPMFSNTSLYYSEDGYSLEAYVKRA